MPIVEAWKAHSKVFVLPIKIQTKRDVMQETFSLFHSRDKATDRPVTSRGEGGGRLTFTELSSNHTISSSSPGPPNSDISRWLLPLYFSKTSSYAWRYSCSSVSALACGAYWAITRAPLTGHSPAVDRDTAYVCPPVCACMCICVCALRSQEWSALLLRRRKRPRSRPCLAPWPIGNTSSHWLDWKDCAAKNSCL